MNSKVVQIAIAPAKVGIFSENTIFFSKKSSDSYKFSLDLYHFLLFIPIFASETYKDLLQQLII